MWAVINFLANHVTGVFHFHLIEQVKIIFAANISEILDFFSFINCVTLVLKPLR